MKAIKVEEKNADLIEAALAAINGKDTEHCFTSYEKIVDLCKLAEDHLVIITLLDKSHHAGAQVLATSSSKVANAYKSRRIATRVVLVRQASGWYLQDVIRTELFPNQGGEFRVYLTKAQAEKATEAFQKQFQVL